MMTALKKNETLVKVKAGQPLWQARLQDPNAWKKVAAETIMWVLFACIIIEMLKAFAPGYPFIVNTPSVRQGLYWRDTTGFSHARGDITSFEYMPTQPWLKERYWKPDQIHTKRIVGIPGDTISVDLNGKIEVCARTLQYVDCSFHGQVLKVDTQKRPMYSFVPLGTSYTLKANEAWLMGEHPKSNDSRYQGPVPMQKLMGKAKLLIGWDD